MNEQKFNVKCGFFDSIDDDRLYSADEMNKPYDRLITEGVYATPEGTPSNDLQVLSADSGLNIIVKRGQAYIGKKWFENQSDITITIVSNNEIVPRIDSIIAQVDKRQGGRVGNIVYREGEANSNPKPPTINNDENIIEMRIANIYVSSMARFIGQDVITDLRGSKECPWITSLIKQPDTSTLYLQWQAAYQKYYDDETQAFNEFMKELTEQLTVNTNIVKYQSHFVSSEESTVEIPINIPTFKKDKDILLVCINNLIAIEDVDYTIDSNEQITLTKNIEKNQQIDFIVLQSLVIGDTENVLMKLQTLTEEVIDLKKKIEELSVN